MQTWVYFVLLSQFIWAFCSLIDKFVLSNKYIENPAVYIVLNGLTSLFIIFLIPFFGFEPLKFGDFLIAFIAGVSYSAAVVIYYKAVQDEEISRITILYQMGPIFVLILSYILLGEKLNRNHFIGFLLLIFAGIFISYKSVNGKIKLSKAFWLMSLSLFLGSAGVVAVKQVYSTTGFWNAFLWLKLTTLSALGVLIAPSVRKDFSNTFKKMKPKIKGLMVFKMIIDFIAFVFSGYAIKNAPISLVTALSSAALPLFVFFLVLISSVYFPMLIKEDMEKKTVIIKLLSIVVIIIGLLFASS